MHKRLGRGMAVRWAQSSLLTLALLSGGQAAAQDAKPAPVEPPAKASDDSAAKSDSPNPREIVVYGGTTLTAALKNAVAEQTYDPDRVSSYGATSVGELLDAITSENGDEEPQILINGQPTRNVTDISDLPVEAVARI